ncbi:unnamed protein product [Pedinophyceae sp. YPF-701]|nr:unnamed protein product [Pedinophyceae sp. YPF-701]
MTAPVRAISGAAAAPPAARCQSKRGSVATQAQRPPAASAAAESASTERTAADTGAFAHPMGPEEFRAAAHEVVDWIADYMTTVEERPVRSQVEPGYLMSALPTSCPEQGESWDACMRDLEGLIMPGVTHWQHPSFFAYYPANSSGPGMLGEMLSAAINCIGFSWIASPAATELETVALDWLGQLVGLPASFLSATGTGSDSGDCQRGGAGGAARGAFARGGPAGVAARGARGAVEGRGANRVEGRAGGGRQRGRGAPGGVRV